MEMKKQRPTALNSMREFNANRPNQGAARRMKTLDADT
jgi:hypothetical protein